MSNIIDLKQFLLILSDEYKIKRLYITLESFIDLFENNIINYIDGNESSNEKFYRNINSTYLEMIFKNTSKIKCCDLNDEITDDYMINAIELNLYIFESKIHQNESYFLFCNSFTNFCLTLQNDMKILNKKENANDNKNPILLICPKRFYDYKIEQFNESIHLFTKKYNYRSILGILLFRFFGMNNANKLATCAANKNFAKVYISFFCHFHFIFINLNSPFTRRHRFHHDIVQIPIQSIYEITDNYPMCNEFNYIKDCVCHWFIKQKQFEKFFSFVECFVKQHEEYHKAHFYQNFINMVKNKALICEEENKLIKVAEDSMHEYLEIVRSEYWPLKKLNNIDCGVFSAADYSQNNKAKNIIEMFITWQQVNETF
ncbi:hypothetical protein COBT_000961 [Conglomerata obtusa]